MSTQVLVWVDKKLTVAVTTKPNRVWVVPGDKKHKPSLPYTPLHGSNAFLEDEGHDWHWERGVLKHRGIRPDGNTWLLLEYD